MLLKCLKSNLLTDYIVYYYYNCFCCCCFYNNITRSLSYNEFT